ncbi:hypothetical protein NP233_g9302 [Leucocoprinus birnbaumii]|uniref:Brl1/Brr6 domain-containing protein n=1 Tax=Leucocoprinus birnbaumii TaxID=56174 RepID=A0AAD5VKP5_9AGAR|nr:hypothetical protein NP233_g9302 [Leucocoprinus birnbaumii]
MDFEWTDRPGVRPVWSNRAEDLNTPRKRPIEEVNSPQPQLGTPQTPVFGSNHNQNVPFIFQSPQPSPAPSSYPWAPNSSSVSLRPDEPTDIDMLDSSPNKVDPESDEKETGRPIALGALRRVYHRRHGSRAPKSSRRHQKSPNEDLESGSDSETDDQVAPITQRTSNHYTVNMPPPAPAPSETPYVLLGYLQFFFNLSLVLLFLYLALQFIITIQRDVQHRISEYSQDIVQEIAMCALQFKNNLCEGSPVPAMIQQCSRWETCMNRDPAVVGRAKVSAELIAEVVNGFVEPISWKTLIFTLTSLAFLTIFVNALLSLYRARHQPQPQSQPYPIAPGAPFTQPYPAYLASAPNNWSRSHPDDSTEAPSRRRKLEGGNSEKIK